MKFRTMISKGDIMRKVYSEEENGRIDSSTPVHTWAKYPPIDHVMNYNEPNTYGKLENIYEVAEERKVQLFHQPKIWWKDFENIKYAFEKIDELIKESGNSDHEYAMEALKDFFDFKDIPKEEPSKIKL